MKKSLLTILVVILLLFNGITTTSAKEGNVLKRGDKSIKVLLVKQDLAEIGFAVSSNPNTIFGPATERTVIDFQKYYNLNVTGIIEASTFKKIDEILKSPFRNGRNDNQVVELKKKLDILGFKVSDNPNSRFGPQTEKKVKEFQAFYNLVTNGIADEITLREINNLLNTPLKRGDYRKDVISLKENLAKLGFVVSDNPTPAFGPATERVVKEFQEYYGLDINGIVDVNTQDKLRDLKETVLRKGDKSKEVLKLKQELSKVGFIVSSNPNTIFGPATERLVKDFQKYYQLKTTGIADEITYKKIDEILTSPFRNGRSHDQVIDLKKKLEKLGFKVSNNPNTRYGPQTEAKVKEFQTFYKLVVNGIADEVTLTKIETLFNAPLQRGDYRKDVILLKQDLAKLGFVVSTSPTPAFGPATERVVKEFQAKYGLNKTGIVDETTTLKIKELLKQHKDPEQPTEKTTYTNYNVTLTEALNTQMNQLQQTDKYRNDPAYVSARYLDISQHAAIFSTGNVILRSAPNIKNDTVMYTVSNGTKITVLGETTGDVFNGSNKWYRINYGNHKETLYVHSNLVKLDTMIGTVTATVNVRAGTNTSTHIFGKLTKGTEVTIIKEGNNWHQIAYQTWRNPTRADVEYYLNPSNNDEFQHLVLSSSAGVTASELNKVLSGQGILHGLGQAFIEGGAAHKVNEVYLISHAFLETGRGTSKLATGVEVGRNKSGNLVLVTSSNRKNLKDIKTTYNMFGIGAADADPLRLGAIRAYEEGWFTPQSAIKGGAKFIGERYIHNSYQQNTLYKMRWNPANPGYPQYATDVGWAVKQVTTIKRLYDQLSNPFLHFDIPVYK